MKQSIMCIALVAGLFSSIARAEFTETKTADGLTLNKVAVATFGYLLFDISKSALYVNPSEVKPASIMTPGYSKAIEIKYLLSVSKEKFTELTWEALRKGWPKETLARYKSQIDAFCALYQDVEKGERYSLFWKQGYGLELAKNGLVLGRETNSDAAYVILSIWLGRAAADEDHLKEMLKLWRAS